MNRNQEAIETIKSLYCPRGKVETMKDCLYYLETNRIREIRKTDARKSHFVALVIETKGKGSRECFSGWYIKYLDINHVGETYAEVYVYDEDESGFPQKIRINNPRLSIIL